MFYKKIMVFVKGIYYNKKYVKMEKALFMFYFMYFCMNGMISVMKLKNNL